MLRQRAAVSSSLLDHRWNCHICKHKLSEIQIKSSASCSDDAFNDWWLRKNDLRVTVNTSVRQNLDSTLSAWSALWNFWSSFVWSKPSSGYISVLDLRFAFTQAVQFRSTMVPFLTCSELYICLPGHNRHHGCQTDWACVWQGVCCVYMTTLDILSCLSLVWTQKWT